MASQDTETACYRKYTSVDSTDPSEAPFERSPIFGKHPVGTQTNGAKSAQKCGLALSMVQSDEWQARFVLPPLWRQVVRGRRLRRGGHHLCSLAEESTPDTDELGFRCLGNRSASEVPQTWKGQGARQDTQPSPKAESIQEGKEALSTSRAAFGSLSSNDFTCVAHESRAGLPVLDGFASNATSGQPSGTGFIGSNTSTSSSTCGTAAKRCYEESLGVAQKGPGETIARKPRLAQDAASERGERRGKGTAGGSQKPGTCTTRSPGSVRSKGKPSSEMEDVSLHERDTMAEFHAGIPTAGDQCASADPDGQRHFVSGQTRPRDVQGGFSLAQRSQKFNRSSRFDVGRGCERGLQLFQAPRRAEPSHNVAEESPSGGGGCARSGASHEKSQVARRNRRLQSPWWKSYAAFSIARYCATVGCEYLGHCPERIAPELFRLKWRHSILEEPDFRTEWHARVAATRLSFECGTILSNTPLSQSQRVRPYQSKDFTVTFEDSFSLICNDPESKVCSIFHGVHGQVRNCIESFRQKLSKDADPLSPQGQAVLISLDSDTSEAISLMQLAPQETPQPHRNNEPNVPAWYPLNDRGVLPADEAPEDEESFEVESSNDGDPDRSNDEDPDDSDHHDPEDDPIHPPNDTTNRQSALMYHLDDHPIHVMLYWTEFERLMQEIALHFQVERAELLDSYELTVRPLDIPEGTAPLIVHLVNDFPHGAQMALALVDIEIHGNIDEQNFQTMPASSRRVIPMPVQLTREAFLRLTDTFEFCRLEHNRCLIEVNHRRWHLQQHAPIQVANGDYFKLIVPPPEKCDTPTHAMLNDSRHMTVEEFWAEYYVPTSPVQESGESSPNVSPSLIDSEDIKQEFGHNYTEDRDDLSQMQHPVDVTSLMQLQTNASSSSSAAAPTSDLAAQVATIVNESCLLACNFDFDNLSPDQPCPLWLRALNTAFSQNCAVEHANEGPVAYFDTWFADCRSASASEVSRDLRLDIQQNLWIHDIQHLWRDKIIPGVPVYIKWVFPTPPRSPLSRSSGHLIVFQFPGPQLVPFLLTIHFQALDVQGSTHVCVVEDRRSTPLQIVDRVNMVRVCRGRKCTVHRGTIGATWSVPLNAGEGLKLFVPPYGAHAHLDSLSRPNSVELIQTAPPPDETFEISMRLEDHRPFIRELHAIWARRATRGPADMENLFEITTWYLDAQYVPYNDASRPALLGDDFFAWEQQLHELWADLADASLDFDYAFVNPVPGDSPMSSIHVLLMQNFQNLQDDTIGSVVTTYDNSVRPGTPFSAAVCLPRNLLRRNIVQAINRPSMSQAVITTWSGSFEIQDAEAFIATHGQNFNVIIYRPFLPSWESDHNADEDQAMLQTNIHMQADPKHDDDRSVSARAWTPFRTQAIRIVPEHCETAGWPTYIEISGPISAATAQHELRKFGLDVQTFIIDHQHAAFCRSAQTPHTAAVIFVHSIATDDARYFQDTLPLSQVHDPISQMRALYGIGFEKAVITELHCHSHDVFEIHFQEPGGHFTTPMIEPRVQKPWPQPQPTFPHQPMYSDITQESTCCLLDLGICREDLRALFIDSSWPLCTITEGIGLPVCSIEACEQLVSDCDFDRLIIHTDGSSHSGKLHRSTAFIEECAIPDAWAFLVLGEKYLPEGGSRLTLIGWMAQQVRYDEVNPFHIGALSANPLIAEREALTWAFIWRIMLNSTIPTTFRTDSLTTKGQAEGTIGSANCDQSLQLLRGCYQLLETALDASALQISHVFGHLGEPWNEFVDHIAKMEAVPSFYLPRPALDLHKWKRLLPHLWLLFAGDHGAPAFRGNGFHVPPPNLPKALPDMDDVTRQRTASQQTARHSISLASANVLSLGRPDQGHKGKIDYLRKQFADLHINLLGLQETRADNGASVVDGILRLSFRGVDYP